MSLDAADFRTLFESAPGAYLVLSLDLRIVAVSGSYLRATMTTRDNIIGRPLFEVFPDNPNDLHANGTSNLRASLDRVIASNLPDTMAIQKYDIRKPAEQGGGFEERHWSPVNSPVFDENGKLSYIIHRVEDVTEFVHLKQQGMEHRRIAQDLEERADQLEQLRQAQRMEAMGQLAGGIAHDFNNLLAITMMSCDEMLEVPHSPQEMLESFAQIKKTSERAASLTRQLLAFSRKQVLQPVPLNLNHALVDLERMFSRVIKQNVKIVTSLEEKLDTVLVDLGQFEQLVMNLVVNARDAIPGNGKITIQTANVELDKFMASGVPRAEAGSYVMISVSDTGVGMEAATQARIFEPFFTTKPIGKGTGLGLATVYGIVAQNKGTIWVYSELGKGTTIKVYLPKSSQPRETAVAPRVKSKSIRNAIETILVVEDSDVLRQVICKFLRSAGYQVIEADNGKVALELAEKFHQPIDLVVTDVVMPEMGGRELSLKLRELKIETKVLFLSGYTEESLADYGFGNEHPNFLEKPFTRDSLLEKVQSVLG